MAMRRGTAEAEKGSGKGSFHKVDFLKIEDGKYAAVRFLDDPDPIKDANGVEIDPIPYGLGGWITVASHTGSITRPAPDNYDGKWPGSMPSTCRNDSAVAPVVGAKSCYLCDHGRDSYGKDAKAVDRTWTLAILREEVYAGGKMVGLRDVIEEWEEEGKPMSGPKVVYVNFAWSNFFGPLAACITTIPGQESLLNRDIRITRKGTGTATKYHPTPYPPMPEIGRDDRPIEVNGQPFVLDLRIPEHAAVYKTFLPNLEEAVTERATDDYYAYFFDVGVPQPVREKKKDDDGKGGNAPASSGGAPAAPPDVLDNEPTADDLAAIASRIHGYGPKA